MRPSSPRSFGARPVRTPVVLQMESTECGAASLGIVLGFFGRHVPLEELREACAVSRDGMNALKLVEVARRYHLEARGFRYDLDDLAMLAGPFVVFWHQNHFLVVEGFARRKVHLNDPASGRRQVSYEEFAEGYSGVTLVLRPGEEFHPEPRGRRQHPVATMLSLVGQARAGLAYALIAGLAVVVPTTAAAMLTSIFVSQVLESHDTAWVGRVVAVAAVIVVAQFSLILFQQRVLLRLQTKLSIRMSAGFLWHLLRLPLRFFDARSPGGLVSRVQLNFQVAQLLSGQLATVAIGVLTMALYGVVLFLLDWRLALVALAVASCNAATLVGVSRARVAVNQNLQQNLVRLSGYSYLGISLIEDLKATGGESEFFSRWSGTQARALNAEQRLGFLTQSLLVVPGFLTMLDVVVILAVGGSLVIDGALSLAALIAFQMLASAFFAPISQVVSVASQFQNARAWLQQVDDVTTQRLDPRAGDAGLLDDDPGAGEVARRHLQVRHSAPGPPSAGTAAGRLSGQVELRGLSFGYVPGEAPLLENLNLVVEPGQRVAFVGPSGSGKSTIANLVAGLLQPWEGEIRFDGLLPEEINPEVLGASLAKVDQAVMLFRASVAQNIAFFDESIAPGALVRAAQDACVASEIEARAGGYSHLVEERGANFSGGQRQRLEIARALAGDPSILVLDEATSALDAVTEQRLDTHLRQRGCTSLIVSHRLSTIRDCDQILVLDQGQVVERGTHRQLLGRDGSYARLVSHA